MKNLMNEKLATKNVGDQKCGNGKCDNQNVSDWNVTLIDGDKKCGYWKMAIKDVAIESWQPKTWWSKHVVIEMCSDWIFVTTEVLATKFLGQLIF
jgi:hypothetical protein